MDSADVLVDGFGRIHDGVHHVLDGLGTKELTFRIDPKANTIAWLVWHLARVQDDHVAGGFDTEQVWSSAGWADRFGLPFEHDAIGYGQSAKEVGAVRVPAELLLGYHDDVHAMTIALVHAVSQTDLDRIVDPDWDPPVTLGVRLVSVISDALQHLGQAAYVRGVEQRQ